MNIYLFMIHSYLSFCNIVWASKYEANLSKSIKKQKHAVHIVYNKDKYVRNDL